MPFRRLVRLLTLVVPLMLGLAAGAERGAPVAAAAVTTIGAPRESLPRPVHDEATCAFCQAAIFPPCAPHPADVTVGAHALVRESRVAPDARLPRFTSHRPASSRSPPTLRSA